MNKPIKIHNKSDKPNNIVIKENELIERCISVEKQLPIFMKDYFIYLKGAVVISTRLAYLEDTLFFCKYIVSESSLSKATTTDGIAVSEFNEIKARDINEYLGDYCTRYYKKTELNTYIFENHNRALARKKSSIASLFKFLYRNDQIENNITDGFNPIRLPKPQPDAIKRLEIDEVAKMIDIVESANILSEKERTYWEKTKLRDKAILILFVTYGLRLSELRELNISSFNMSRGEFKIYRKRSKEVLMPLNKSCENVINDYIDNERKNFTPNEEDEDALFLSMQNKRMTTKAIRELVKKYTSYAMGTTKENGYSPHKLRATSATSLIQYGFSIYDVQNLLDHDNVTTTQLYAAHKKNVKREIVKNFEWLEPDKEKND